MSTQRYDDCPTAYAVRHTTRLRITMIERAIEQSGVFVAEVLQCLCWVLLVSGDGTRQSCQKVFNHDGRLQGNIVLIVYPFKVVRTQSLGQSL